MDQRFCMLPILLVCLSFAWARDTKPLRSMPAISNSLVNLGKMDISFHFNTKSAESSAPKMEHYTHSASPFYISKPEPQVEIEPCPCSSLKTFKNPFLSNPSELINRVLRSNDLFSVNQESTTSTLCCDSHEHVEDTVLFEFTPKNNLAPLETSQVQTYSSPLQQALPSFPLILDSILPKAPFSNGGSKKAVEIFFFPKNKEIKIVGDKDFKKDFKSLKYRPTFPLLSKKEKDTKSEKINEKQEEKQRLEDKENEELKKAELKAELKASDSKEENVETTTTGTATVSAPNSL